MKKAIWRISLFRAGCGALLLSVVLYVYAWKTLLPIKQSQLRSEAGAHYFLAGCSLNLLAFCLMMFGYGWKRLPLGLFALLSIFAWNVFTIYC